jgi:hypothetical protein
MGSTLLGVMIGTLFKGRKVLRVSYWFFLVINPEGLDCSRQA